MDVSLSSPILMIPAGVTLDLNGYTLAAPNVFSFGNIIDSGNGEGGIQISHDRAVSAVHLQQNNQDFPLYDSTRGAYRFFSYAVASAGKKPAPGDAEKEWVKFGVKIVFDAEDAYRLLLDEANADVTLTMELMVKQRSVIVRISEETIRLLAQTVLSDFSKRSRLAVTLTVYGLEELPDTSCLSLTPTLYSECDVQGQSEKMRYYAATPAQRARSWVLDQMENDTWFSFDYDGAPYAEHIGSWSKSITETEDGWTLSYTKDDLTAWSEIVLDEETACVEWTNYFKNSSTSKFLQISNIQAINSAVFVENPQLTTAEGSNNNTTDFQPIHVDLTQEPNYSMASTGGRSSQGAFPYFEIHNGNYGVMGGIGWTGNWKADFENADGTVSIAAGMQNVNTYLKKNEQMRTPMIMMMFYEGDQQDGHNAFRTVIQKRYTPVDESGKPITEVPVFVGINAANGESALISQMQTLEQKGRYFDGLWIDATWFGDIPAGSSLSDSGWGKQVGSWEFNESYPNGNMLSVSNWLADRDKELLVWFEPERVYFGTTLYNQYLWSDGFLLSTGSLTDRPLTKLWNFANDTARDVMIDTISSIISTNKITWYRQDFNIEPEIYWEHADEPNRVGMTEIKYITNLYDYLDALVEKNPGLMIDNCASGGRRLDLEMMRRSVPLWRSDITTDQSHGSTPDNVRTLAYNLSWWLPLHGGGYPSYNSNTTSLLYDMRSHFTGAQLRPAYEDETVISQVIEEYFSYKDLLTEEYHILACGADEDIETVNSAYEYYGAQESRGFVMTFRPQGSEEELTYYKLKGLDPLATYCVTVTDTGETFTAGGYTLMNRGLLCRYPTAAHSLLITFVKQVPQV
jgi:alpha-galactosidase